MAKSIDRLKFQDLMQYRVHEILLVASPYDAFILEQDGRLSEQILTEFKGLNLSYAPRIWNADSASKALEMIKERPYDLVIIMLRISDMDPIKFSERLKIKYPKKPIVLLAFDVDVLQFTTIIATYTSSIILGVASFLPMGIGVTEGSLAGFFALKGVDISLALTIVIFIRIFTRWIGVALGFILLKIVGGFAIDTEK